MAASPLTMEQELQVIRPVQRSPGWDRYLPNGAQIRASFFKFPPDPSPTTSEEEADPTARRQRVLPMPPQENVTVAGKFMSDFLGQYHQNGYHAIAGGFALKIRGLDRATADIDICFRGQLPALFRILLQTGRFVLPETTMHVQCFQMYLRTGPAFQDPECTSNHIIKVELLLEGLHESGFQHHIVDVQTRIAGQPGTLRTLDVFCLTKSKIHAYFDSQRPKDYRDVLGLMEGHSDEIKANKYDLDQEFARSFVQEGMLRNRERQETIDWARKILLVSRSPSPQSGSR